MTAPPREKDGRHMTVMIKNWVYAITIYDESGSLMEPKEIEKRIWSAVRDADAKEASGEKATPIGILTADERDTWAKVRLRSFQGAIFRTNQSLNIEPRTPTCPIPDQPSIAHVHRTIPLLPLPRQLYHSRRHHFLLVIRTRLRKRPRAQLRIWRKRT